MKKLPKKKIIRVSDTNSSLDILVKIATKVFYYQDQKAARERERDRED